MQRAAEPAGVLRGQGIIQAKLVLSPFALGGGHFFHAVAVVGDKRVARSEAGDIERQNGEQQHAQQRIEYSFKHISEESNDTQR